MLSNIPDVPDSSLLDLEWDRVATIVSYALLNHYTMDLDFDRYASRGTASKASLTDEAVEAKMLASKKFLQSS
ncbi:hypothetical protein PAXRUDRAFT_21544 [Paxillus rubicundulus Ve08.2h10]|uniref:Uncharacterized protein n=1 Tax=Paxillus rubicundulus Ve08.2h10 TaxID=930991 RepID=A0A0D0BMD1_9AGAM|nr:hypothetical protein PAXRUDRAFT_21544 [Paxillus rubicundulus Ve08.2h10]